MKVKIHPPWLNEATEVELSQALKPDAYYDGGMLEQAATQGSHNAETIGRLLAHLVESKAMTVEEAFQIAGKSTEGVELVPERNYIGKK